MILVHFEGLWSVYDPVAYFEDLCFFFYYIMVLSSKQLQTCQILKSMLGMYETLKLESSTHRTLVDEINMK